MMNNRIINKVIILILFIIPLVLTDLKAQIISNSPYSLYGIGDLGFNKNKTNLGMAGLGIAYRSPFSVNYLNPASYTAFDTMSFVFDTGIEGEYSKIRNNTASRSSSNMSVTHFVFGFPIYKWWRSSIGLLPFSDIGYKISDYEDTKNIGKVHYLFEGSGGIRQFYFGNAFKIKNFSIGFNFSYLFGTMEKDQTVYYPKDTIINYDIKTAQRIIPNDIYFNYGLQYSAKLNKDYTLTCGLIFNTNSNIHSKKDYLAERLSNDIVIDTAKMTNGTKGTIKIPGSLGLGVCIANNNKWLIGIDGAYQQWSKYEEFGINGNMKDSWRVAIGGELIPDYASTTKYMNKVRYRLGLRFEKTHLFINNQQIYDYSLNYGFIFPLKRTKTCLNLGFELGRMGKIDQISSIINTANINSSENDVINELYCKFTFILNINEKWFMKRKFD